MTQSESSAAPEGGWPIMKIALDGDLREVRVPLGDAASFDDWSRNLGIGDFGEIVQVDNGPLVAAAHELAGASADSLAAALEGRDWDSSLYVDRSGAPVREDFLDLEDRFRIEVAGGRLVAIVTDRRDKRPAESEADVSNRLERVARNYRCSVHSVRYLLPGGTAPSELFIEHGDGLSVELVERMNADVYAGLASEPHDVEISLVTDSGETVGVLIAAASALADFLAALDGGAVTAATILDMCRAGHHLALLEMAESDFLEVKSAPYAIWKNDDSGRRAKVELAQDVARFANGEVDAILLVGFCESKNNGSSVIDKCAPVNLDLIDPVQIGDVLDARVVPPLAGLVVEQIPTGDGKGLLAILVPKQPSELQPFLVHGAIVGDKLEGDFFSIVHRRGEGSITTTAHQVHAYIVAGKRYLRDDGRLAGDGR